MSTLLFTQTAQKEISNTADETTMIGSGSGNLTLPERFFEPGKTLKVSFSGTIADTDTPDVVVQLKLGSTVLVTTGAQSLPTITGTCDFYGEAKIVCRSKYDDLRDTAGSVMADMDINFGKDDAGGNLQSLVAPATLTESFDTRSSYALDLTFTWDSADTDNVLKVDVLTVEHL